MNPPERIYLDHAATTPVREEVCEAMRPYLAEYFGNAGSLHRFGREARKAVEEARKKVASLIGADPRDLIFTSGGTEANNLAIQGLAREGSRLLVSAVEHHSVLHPAELAAKRAGAVLEIIPVDSEGRINIGHAASLLSDDCPALVSVMQANNETGTIQPIEEVGATCQERGIPFHTDAVQAAGKIPLDVTRMPADLVSLSAHKLYGPKGIGALYVRREIRLAPQMVGGSQERGRRAGTENVAAMVGFGAACELAQREMETEAARLRSLLQDLEDAILARIPGAWINGSRQAGLPSILNVGFPGVEGEAVMFELDSKGIAVSTGSACTSGTVEASHVLLAMGQDHTRAHSGVRFSLGRGTTSEMIEAVSSALESVASATQAKRG